MKLARRGTAFLPVVLLLGLLAVQAPVASRAEAPVSAQPRAEILWDTWGVPHIFAADAAGLFHAFGWAQMHAHGNLLLRLYGEARGRSAEYWGPAQRDHDRWMLTHGVPQRARSMLARLPAESRGYVEAFVAGINAYAAAHPEQLAEEVRVVLPVEAADVLAHFQRVIHYEFLAPRGVAAAASRGLAPAGASNAWAVAPRRTAGGHALLLANPHLAWSGWGVFFEAHLVAPGVDASGAALAGTPTLSIGFNDHLGWTHTVNTLDAVDLYELTLAEGGYRFDGGVRPFETSQHILKVRQADGTLREETLTVRRSVHGPVVAESGGKAVALRVAGLDQANIIEQYWRMMRARNLAEFEAALKMLQMPMFTVMYADREGNILHLFGGRVPKRPDGNWDWSGVVPGDTPATLWTSTHPYEELPRVLNPPSGWLQNANDPPWTTTFPPALDPAKFPRYMAPRGMHFRAQHSARLLEEAEKMTFDEFVKRKHSTRLELADAVLDDLIAAARQGSDLAQRAAAVLERWDRLTDAESRGGVLFRAFWQEYARRAGARTFAVAWDEKQPRTTPRGLGDPEAAVAALEAAARQLESIAGALDIPWGEANRLRIAGADLPANGGPGGLGAFRVTGYAPARDGRFMAVSGDSYVAAVEFSSPVRAKALVSYGNSTQPGSPHRTDQLPLYSRKELRPVWRARKDIEANLSRRETPGKQ